MPTSEQFVSLLDAQVGDVYVFGAEASPSNPDPDVWDCSEIIEWACARLGITPRMPDGSWNQVSHCKRYGTLIPVDQAIGTRGALLFRFSSDPFTSIRPTHSHVAASHGDGTTIEARGRSYGVGSWSAYDRGWTHAALIPGLNYDTTKPPGNDGERSMFVLKGDRGPEVEYWQRRLVRLGADLTYNGGPPHGIDGQYGNKTAAAVSSLVDGSDGQQIGPYEAEVLDAAIAMQGPPGPAGPAGPQGPQGPQGPTGPLPSRIRLGVEAEVID